jgi:hypothetical protein
MNHFTCIDFSISERTRAVVQVASPSPRGRGRVRVAFGGYPASVDKTPHLDPLRLSKGRGEEEQNSHARS